jgi:hypothetical protein
MKKIDRTDAPAGFKAVRPMGEDEARCQGCWFLNNGCAETFAFECFGMGRVDGRNVIFAPKGWSP